MSNHVEVWLGLAKNKTTYRAFLKEQYKDDNQPISPFAASQGETFYDHDFLETEFCGEGMSVSDSLYSVSYGSSFAGQVAEAAGDVRFNFFILSYSEDFSAPKSAQSDGIELTYIGRFEFDPAAIVDPESKDVIYIHILNGQKLMFESELTDCIKVDMRGLMIGRENPYARMLDISSVVPNVADNQLRISMANEGYWELRDFGNNGLSRLGAESFDNEKAAPWPGVKFSVGEQEFLWSDSPHL